MIGQGIPDLEKYEKEQLNKGHKQLKQTADLYEQEENDNYDDYSFDNQPCINHCDLLSQKIIQFYKICCPPNLFNSQINPSQPQFYGISQIQDEQKKTYQQLIKEIKQFDNKKKENILKWVKSNYVYTKFYESISQNFPKQISKEIFLICERVAENYFLRNGFPFKYHELISYAVLSANKEFNILKNKLNLLNFKHVEEIKCFPNYQNCLLTLIKYIFCTGMMVCNGMVINPIINKDLRQSYYSKIDNDFFENKLASEEFKQEY